VQTRLVRSTLVLGFLAASAGCKRSDPTVVSESQCRTGCQRSVTWQLAKERKKRVHPVEEADEAVDRMEAEANRDIANATKMRDQGDPSWDEKSLVGLAPKDRSAAVAHHEFMVDQRKRQWDLAIERSHAAVDAMKKNFAEQKQKFDAWESKTVPEATEACLSTCMKRPPAYAECLGKTQSVPDIAICDRM
jgi:hypothetical protein